MRALRAAVAVASLLAAPSLVACAAPTADAPLSSGGRPSRILVVSPRGSDGSSGTVRHPLRTIQVAVQRLPHGGRVELRGGTYHQRVRLRRVHGLTLEPYHGEAASISGVGLTPPAGLTGLIEIAGSTHVTVRGLDLTGYRTTSKHAVPAGIVVQGHDRAVTVAGNHVHDLGNDNATRGSFAINAHGIAAYGTDPHAPITGLRIRDNEVDHLHLGASETVVVNGNVDGWSIVGNHIHGDDNIGIDAIGYEPTLPHRYRYTTRDRARHGLVADNVVTRIRSQGNPAYWDNGHWCNCADGIYVDGGTRIRVLGNRVSDSDIGVEVAAENGRGQADHVRVSRNHITGSLFTGLSTGGYCDGAKACGGVQTGSSHNNTFDHNTLRGNNRLDDGSPEMLIQYHAYRDTFRFNSITATSGSRTLYGTVPRSDSHGNRSDHNAFHVDSPARRARFGWDGHTYRGLPAFRRATGQDLHSTLRSRA